MMTSNNTATDPEWYLRVQQKEVKLLPSVPCVLRAAAASTTTEKEGHGDDIGGGSSSASTLLLPELARHPQMQVFRPYLETLQEEDQMAVALRLEMEHMRDIFILDRTIGYGVWAEAHPEAHRLIQSAKPLGQTLVLPPRLDDILEMLPGGGSSSDDCSDSE